MLKLTIEATEMYDDVNEEFITIPKTILSLEHSLISLSKWESKWCVPFLSSKDKTEAQTIDYVRCMTLTQNVNEEVYKSLTTINFDEINSYIEQPMTATTIKNDAMKKTSREIITAELIYYWMVAFNIPFECQKWHLNKLLTLINVCSIKQTPPKQMGKSSALKANSALNAQRKAALGTRG